VDAIQACGGQKTADGRRSRNGGGILWNIIKTRDPNAYKEIMRKGKEFEKQFKQQKQDPVQHTETSCRSVSLDADQVDGNPLDDLKLPPHDQSQHDISTAGQKRAPVHDRIRMPVIYDDDLLGGQDSKDKLA
ncbi:hypothetical protein C2S51_038914, partial [Perilla frutescens var. frutescens]